MCGCFAASALCIWRCFTIGKLEHQINEEIRDKELRVIGADGSQLGIMTSSDALALAEWNARPKHWGSPKLRRSMHQT